MSCWRGKAGWAAYFPDDDEEDPANAMRSSLVHELETFFAEPAGRHFLEAVPGNTFALPIDFSKMCDPESPKAFRTAAELLRTAPDDALSCIGLAASRAAEELCERSMQGSIIPVTREHRLWPRIFGHRPLTPLKSLKGNSVGRFISIRGTVVRVSNIRQQVTAMEFECAKCGATTRRTFVDYRYSAPTSCDGGECKSRLLLPRLDSAETVDWQKIRVQEIVEATEDGSSREEGRMPRTIDAELFADVIDSCIPGDIVVLSGIVRVLSVDTPGNGGSVGGGARSKSAKAGKCLYYLYIEGNSLVSSRQSPSGARAGHKPHGRVEEEADVVDAVVREVMQQPDPFAFLVSSAVPSIFGHELVKAGMLLALFGGATRERIGGQAAESKGTVSIRRDVHCLVVGDPGLGKSQMLKAVAGIAPRGVYVCGNTTSTAGLTVAVVREASGDFALEAGALVLGDRGVCCIDEFDKMGADHGALLEAMEQQSVSVAKAGMLCNLSARTTVIAAANPVGGHYDRAKTVCENLKMALPLLSRFDLVFILVDNPDEERDRFISEHVMSMFGMRKPGRSLARGKANARGPQPRDLTQRPLVEKNPNLQLTPDEVGTTTANIDACGPTRPSLLSRLRSCSVGDALLPPLFRQYVAYARSKVHPVLSAGAKKVLQEFYLRLRREAHEQAADTTPITTRQLESLIRLAEARARSELRREVTEGDAQDVIEIMRESMLATLTDETGEIDLGRSTGMSRSKDARLFVAALHAESQRVRSAIFDKTALKRVAESIGVQPVGERFDTLIETINYQGYVTKKGPGRYELQSSAFASSQG